jgi:Lhr-like helicase
MYYIKKYLSEDGSYEFISPEDVFDFGIESESKLNYYYMFLTMIAKELNYYNHNVSTSFGNPDLEFYRGQVRGFLAAKKWSWEEINENNATIIVVKSRTGRIVLKIEKPSVPEYELKRRQEIEKDHEILGF